MTTDLLTNIQSEILLHPNIAEIIGLLILVTIFLAISKTLMGKRKKSADVTTLKPNIKNQVKNDVIPEPNIGNQIKNDVIPEPNIEKNVISKIDLESKENLGTFKSYAFIPHSVPSIESFL